MSVDTNWLVIPEAPPSDGDSAGGASGDSVGKSTQTAPGATTKTTTQTVDTPTVALTYAVEPAKTFFAPSRVRFRIEGTVDGRTYAKQYNLPGQAQDVNLFEVQWDGTDNLGNRMPDGDYTVRLSVYYQDVEDPRYKYESSTHTITVKADTYPIAEIEVDREDFSVDAPIVFDGRNSHDPDDGENPTGDITAYAWELSKVPEGSAEAQSLHSATGTATTYTFSEAGNYTMTLTVTDNDPLPIGSGVRGAGNPPTQPIGTKAVPVPPQTTRREAARTYNLTVHASMIVRILPHPQVESTLVSETSLAIDTEGVPSRGPDPVTGEDPTTATIYYQVTGGGSGVKIFRTRVSLEIGNDQDPDSNPAYSVVLGEKLYGTGLQTTWDGKGTGNQPYGVWNAQIKVDVDVDKYTAEPEAQEWEQTYRSGFLPITVYSYPVADAGVDQAVLLDPETNSVEVSFNGSGSTDPDGIGTSPAITNYSWDFSAPDPADAGTPSSVTSAQPAATTTYYTPGVKTVTLTVTDNDDPALDDEDTAEITVIDFTITKPASDAKVVLPDIAVQGTVGGGLTINWSITIGGTEYSTSTTSGVEGTLSVHPHTFPQNISDFGPSTVAATAVSGNQSVGSKSVNVRCFFSMMGADYHRLAPAASTPNFYEYWKQTSANSGNHLYNPNPKNQNWSGSYAKAIGDNPALSYFEIHPLANAHIDHFAKTCLHEDRHRLDFQDMWPNAYPETLAARLTWDRDLDYVKNNYESIWGFDPDDPDSDNDGHIDFEDRGFNAELAWTNGSANSEDWAVGGAQWQLSND